MKFLKLLKLAFIVVICVLVTSCNMMPSTAPVESIETYREIAKSDVESVIHAIETNDENLLKDLFSEYALKSMEDYSASFYRMTDFIDGEIVLSEISLAEETNAVSGGKEKVIIRYVCKLITSSQKEYKVMVSDIVVNEQEKNNCGVYTVCVTSSEYETSSTEQGIHIPQLLDDTVGVIE